MPDSQPVSVPNPIFEQRNEQQNEILNRKLEKLTEQNFSANDENIHFPSNPTTHLSISFAKFRTNSKTVGVSGSPCFISLYTGGN